MKKNMQHKKLGSMQKKKENTYQLDNELGLYDPPPTDDINYRGKRYKETAYNKKEKKKGRVMQPILWIAGYKLVCMQSVL